jgi:hypothetical protein
MGNKTSSHVQHTPLAPQRRFPRVISSRFVCDHVVTLRLPFGFWSHDHATPLPVMDEEMDNVMFQVSATKQGDTNPGRRLLDKNGVPVAELVGFPVGIDYAMYVARSPMPIGTAARAASTQENDGGNPVWQESRVLCYLQTNTKPLEKRLLIQLEDPVTRTPVFIRVDGAWQNREALFWLDRGTSTNLHCIARVYVDREVHQQMKQQKKAKKRLSVGEEENPASSPSTPLSYCVGIAPGVDVALVLLACAAMDEALATKESGGAVEIPTDEITMMLAQRHHGFGPAHLLAKPLALGTTYIG